MIAIASCFLYFFKKNWHSFLFYWCGVCYFFGIQYYLLFQ